MPERLGRVDLEFFEPEFLGVFHDGEHVWIGHFARGGLDRVESGWSGSPWRGPGQKLSTRRFRRFWGFPITGSTSGKSVFDGAASIRSTLAGPGHPRWVQVEIFESAFLTFLRVPGCPEHDLKVRFARFGLRRITLARSRPPWGRLARSFRVRVFDISMGFWPR